ncbi:MAG: acyl-CoA dehydrogenase [Candidatus Hydrogenedentota bacterium]
MTDVSSRLDLGRLDADWTPAQTDVIRRVRAFVDSEVLPSVAEHHEAGTFPQSWLTGIARLDILRYFMEPDGDPVAYGLAMRELERGGSTLRSVVSVQGALTMTAISRYGSEEQKSRWLGPLSRLESIGCFALTEPGFGSNPSAMETSVHRHAGGWMLNGHKRWATNGTLADVAVVWAKHDDAVMGFLVELDAPGVTATPITGKWSFRASESAELRFNRVVLPDSAALPGATTIGKALACLGEARYGIAWGVLGAARACLQETLEYLLNRVQFGDKPIASHQLVQEKFAWMATELAGMELIALRMGELKRRGELDPVYVSLAKMNNCRKALNIARTCRELLGANGILTAFHVGRRMVDLETVVTYEGTEHIHALAIGRHLTGINAFS